MSHVLPFTSEKYISEETSNFDSITQTLYTQCDTENYTLDGTKLLESLKLSKPNNLIISYININSVRNKLALLSELVSKKVDILAIAETKLDNSFPISQFFLDGYKKPYRLDKSEKSGGLLLYVRTDIPCRELRDFSCSPSLQAIPTELTLKDRKWLIIAVYNPYYYLGLEFVNNLSDLIDYYLCKYENLVIIGDMNLEESNVNLINLCNDYNLTNLIHKNTCFKSSKGTCIDLILTNRRSYFQHSNSFETGLSDYHHLIYSMFKMSYTKLSPIKQLYRNFKNFDQQEFQLTLTENLQKGNINNFSDFDYIFSTLLNIHAPTKKKVIRGNHKPYISKSLKKEMMKRAHLKNLFNKSNSSQDLSNYKRQRYLVVVLNKKEKNTFFSYKRYLLIRYLFGKHVNHIYQVNHQI